MYKVYNIHNKVKFSNDSQSMLGEHIDFQFKQFCVSKNEKCHVLDFNLREINVLSKNVKIKYRNQHRVFSVGESEFIIKVGNGYCYMDGTKSLLHQKDIYYTAGLPKTYLVFLLELLIRIHIIQQNVLLVHAAGMEKHNKGIIFPSWKSMGKTTMCIKLAENNYGFMGDDKVFIDEHSNILAYHKYLVLKDSNFKFNLKYLGKIEKILFYLYVSLSKKPFYIIKTMYVRFIGKPLKYLSPKDVFLKTKLIAISKINSIVYLKKSNVKSIKLSTFNSQSAYNIIYSIDKLELDSNLEEFISMHDMLFSDVNIWRKEINSFTSIEKELLHKIVISNSTYYLEIPNDFDFNNNNSFVDEINSLIMSLIDHE